MGKRLLALAFAVAAAVATVVPALADGGGGWPK
jgi:hypothetical protein